MQFCATIHTVGGGGGVAGGFLLSEKIWTGCILHAVTNWLWEVSHTPAARVHLPYSNAFGLFQLCFFEGNLARNVVFS